MCKGSDININSYTELNYNKQTNKQTFQQMASKYTHAKEVADTRQVSISELERALGQLTLEVAEEKQHLKDTFQQIHEMVTKREEELVAELDAISADMSVRVEERKASLEQLTRNRDNTEKELQANRFNEFLKKQLTNVNKEMDKILSEEITLPRLSLLCDTNSIRTTLKEKCLIQRIHNPYTFRTEPVWHRVREGESKGELFSPTAVSVDLTNQLSYVVEWRCSKRVQIFTTEGEYVQTLANQQLNFCRSIKLHGDHIYVSTESIFTHFLFKLNKKGDTVKSSTTDTCIYGLYIEGGSLYSCSHRTLWIQVYDLNLKPGKIIHLKAISCDDDTTPIDVIVYKQQIFVLFRYQNNNYHPDPIQIFQLDGTFIRSLATGNAIKNAKYFCLDFQGRFLVSDTFGHCIKIFTSDGVLLQSIERDSSGKLFFPRGVAVDSKGRILVVDWKEDNTLQAF